MAVVASQTRLRCTSPRAIGGHGERHGERAHQQHERAHRRERDVEDVRRARARRRCGGAAAGRWRSGCRRAGSRSRGTPTWPAWCWRGRWTVRVAVVGDGGGVDGGVSHRRSPPPARRSTAVWLGRSASPSPSSSWSSWPCGGRSSSSGGSSAQPTMPPSEDGAADDGDGQVEDEAVADERERRRTARAASTTAPAGARATGRRPWRPPRRVATCTTRPCSSSLRTCGARSRRAAVTIGSSSKLCSGVGDGMLHSRLRASHGSGPGGGQRGAPGASSGRCCTKNTSDADGDDEGADRWTPCSRS